MKVEYTKSVLASYATFKELYKSQKYTSPYQILSEFIRYIIVSKALYTFTSTEIQGYLIDDFGFNMPIAVIRTALRGIDGIKCENQKYSVNQKSAISSSDFQMAQNKSVKFKADLIDALVNFAESKNYIIDEDILEKELLAFVLDDVEDKEYQKIIGEFVIVNKNNSAITEAISAIQEGGILYSGLTYNISELGSLKKPLTLFLDTEILFDIFGLNGELFKTLTSDFLSLVDVANRGGEIIKLRFFPEVADDINKYYGNAERVICGKGKVSFNHAMQEIVKDCNDISDVSDKKTDMYRKFQIEYGIREFERYGYYDAANMRYNLEDKELPRFPATDQSNFEAIRFCSHVNVLRKGEKTVDPFSSKYLCVTGTRRVLDVSRVLTECDGNDPLGERHCGYAVSLNYITNLLWYKLNRGFGSKAFPQNLDAVIKARIILSGYISQEITTTFNEIKKKSANGELSQEQAAAYIVALKEKNTLPEALNADNIEDNLDFSEEYLSRVAETISLNDRLLKERDTTIKELSEDVESLRLQLLQANDINAQKQQQIDSLAEKIRTIEEENAKEAIRKKIVKNKIRFVFDIAWKIIAIIAITFIIWFICKITGCDFGTWLSVAIGIAGIAGATVAVFKKDLKRYNERCMQAQQDNGKSKS